MLLSCSIPTGLFPSVPFDLTGRRRPVRPRNETVLDLMVDVANVLTVEQRILLDGIGPSISTDTLANENADQ